MNPSPQAAPASDTENKIASRDSGSSGGVNERQRRGASRTARRVFDIFLSSVSLTFLALPLAIIALAIKLSSAGPVIYRQRRVGRGGKLFWLYKFRTMRCTEGGPQVTAEGDPRITRIGRFLRATKLDELPQLVNILRGEMSVIGPRPEVERFVRHYTPEQRHILVATPGLAGLSAMVFPHEAELLAGHPDPDSAYLRYLMPRKLALDLEYERKRTFWSDLRLVGEIALSILGKRPRQDRTFRIPPPGEEPAGPANP
jgi:lipopolysaccharide/colanic/teichoic acid biosynthesis glycosyltransferase